MWYGKKVADIRETPPYTIVWRSFSFIRGFFPYHIHSQWFKLHKLCYYSFCRAQIKIKEIKKEDKPLVSAVLAKLDKIQSDMDKIIKRKILLLMNSIKDQGDNVLPNRRIENIHAMSLELLSEYCFRQGFSTAYGVLFSFSGMDVERFAITITFHSFSAIHFWKGLCHTSLMRTSGFIGRDNTFSGLGP